MTSAYLKRGSSYQVTSKESLDLHDRLPGGNYTIKQDMNGNFYLDHTDDFTMPPKLYGDTVKNSTRILRTFHSRRESTGVLLNGEKGSGKTLLAKYICNTAAEHNIPTILINAPWHGDGFNALIQSIEQPAILLFDEFEKVYEPDKQTAILTLLDGVFPSKKLFILTCNDKWRVDQHMRNRPGRIFYMLDFEGLSSEFIREYCQDNLDDQSQIEKVVQIAGTFDKFNFDMLQALIEEMNRFSETPSDALRILNVKAEFSNAQAFTVKLLDRGREISKSELDIGEEITCNPITQKITVDWTVVTGKDEDGDNIEDYHSVHFNPSDIKKIEAGGTRYTYTKDGITLILSKKVYNYSRIDYDAL